MRCSPALAALLGLALGCGGAAKKSPAGPDVSRLPTPTVKVGECARPEQDGVMSAQPDRRRADRDLDGDGQPETVIADRALCQGDNCYWNVFVRDPDGACERFAGTLAGAALEPAAATGGAMADVRTFWGLGGDRLLIHTYQFRRGGYLLVDAVLCRRVADDRVACAETDPASAP
jgi:hypothetical protein